MATPTKLSAPTEWWKHLRKYNKHRFWKLERRNERADTLEQAAEAQRVPEESPEGL